MENIETKEKILNALEGRFEVTKVERIDWDDGVGVYCEFINKGIEGNFEFHFMGGEGGIENFNYEGEDDLYEEIEDWIDEEVEFKMTLKYKGKNIRFQ